MLGWGYRQETRHWLSGSSQPVCWHLRCFPAAAGALGSREAGRDTEASSESTHKQGTGEGRQKTAVCTALGEWSPLRCTALKCFVWHLKSPPCFVIYYTSNSNSHQPWTSEISSICSSLKEISSDFIRTTCASFDKEILATTEASTQFLIKNFKTQVLEMA